MRDRSRGAIDVLVWAQGEVEAHLRSGDKIHCWMVIMLGNFF